MPFHALITTGQRQEKENFLLYKTEGKLKEGPTNGIHSIVKSFGNWQKPT